MSYPQAQKQILGVLDAIPNGPGKTIKVHEGQATDEYVAEIIENTDQIDPFIAVNFGNRIKPGGRVNGIVGARADSHIVTIVVHCIANTQRTANLVSEAAWERLIGFMPDNCGEIAPALYGGVGEISSAGSPSRYSSVQAYTMMINSDLLPLK